MRKRKHNYPSKRKPAPMVDCPVCGKTISSRGVYAHVRLLHPFELYELKKENYSSNVGKNYLSNKQIQYEKPEEKTLVEIDRETMVAQFGEEHVREMDKKKAKEKEQYNALGEWFGLKFPDE